MAQKEGLHKYAYIHCMFSSQSDVLLSVMESRPHPPRPRPHHPRPRPRPRPDQSRPRPPLTRPRPFKTETETQYFSTGDIGIYRRPSAFIMSLFSFSFSSSLVVSSETETFEPRDRDLWDTRPRPDRDPSNQVSRPPSLPPLCVGWNITLWSGFVKHTFTIYTCTYLEIFQRRHSVGQLGPYFLIKPVIIYLQIIYRRLICFL